MSTTARPARRTLTQAARAATALCLGAALVTGCSAMSDESAPQVAGSASSQQADDAQETRTADGEASTVTAGDQDVAVRQHLARSATIDLRVDDITKAAAAIRSTATAAEGTVTSEEISSRAEHGWGEVVVSVPSSRLDETLEELTTVGSVERRTTSTTDETAAYTDTESRIATMRASIARVRELVKRTDDIEQLVALEGELSTRVADLESLLAQLEAIKDRTTMSPITVSLREQGAPTEPEDGFVAGLAAGWDAFTGSARVTLTALGAATPFALAGALVAAPLVLWRRRRRVSRPVPPAAGAPAP